MISLCQWTWNLNLKDRPVLETSNTIQSMEYVYNSRAVHVELYKMLPNNDNSYCYKILTNFIEKDRNRFM